MRPLKRALFMAATFISTLLLWSMLESFSTGFKASPSAVQVGNSHKQKLRPCGGEMLDTWKSIKAARKDMIEDKFTIAISTYHRPKELNRVLKTLLSARIPSLLDIVVIWKNFDEQEPPNFTSEYGVNVRYHKPGQNSLNDKLWPDPEYRTAGILLSDDDVYYQPGDLEFVFQTWRKMGQDRITGALSRCASPDGQGWWRYSKCEWLNAGYSLILTNLAFAHVGFLDYYWSNDTAISNIREMVDKNFNCEDIAINYAAAMLTGNGPLLVRGHDQYVNLDPSTGISQQGGHIDARSKCLNDFAKAYDCMPLVTEEGRVERGYRHNLWYKSMWDRFMN
ncbi:glycosyl transferase family 64 domain-containing protein [Stachybotrys elegans]|uniref:Glycosyl transferase family 64 domain-containing protein n=1 Tax=Stachybotrys elegans TaxID=80388 RepID=A0A8K0SPY4_9HYPO|nr:glycosyl transferase family 64 domain-containing protein [Stachybotrys elegans]